MKQLCQGQQVGGAGVRFSLLPFTHRLAADAKGFRDKFLGHFALQAARLQCFPQGFLDGFFFCPRIFCMNILEKPAENQNHQNKKYGNCKDT